MKIIGADNLGRENVADFTVAENIVNVEMGETMVESLNKRYSGPGACIFYKLVPDAQELRTGET